MFNNLSLFGNFGQLFTSIKIIARKVYLFKKCGLNDCCSVVCIFRLLFFFVKYIVKCLIYKCLLFITSAFVGYLLKTCSFHNTNKIREKTPKTPQKPTTA